VHCIIESDLIHKQKGKRMAEWLVSGHGWNYEIEDGKGGKIEQVKVSYGVRDYIPILYYCNVGESLDQYAGWYLWDMLLYGQFGGKDAAVKAAVRTSDADGYLNFFIKAYKDDFDNWYDQINDNPSRRKERQVNSYGVWDIDTKQRVLELVPDDQATSLTTIVGLAYKNNVTRIFWGACQHYKSLEDSKKQHTMGVWPAGIPVKENSPHYKKHNGIT
jgi:hypothetical protein